METQDVQKNEKLDKASKIAIGTAAAMAAISILYCGAQTLEKKMIADTLSKQLTARQFALFQARAQVANQKAQQQASAEAIIQTNKQKQDYFSSVPLVVTTADDKGKLVGFSRLLDKDGKSQYSFKLLVDGNEKTVSGTITNSGDRLVYEDDYSTDSDIRTSGEVIHTKQLGLNRLKLTFIVTASGSNRYSVGDVFTASFVLPQGGSNA